MMNVDVAEEKLVVISDLHIGNPACNIRNDVVAFMHEACDAGYSLCINGDGFDVMQTSFTRLAEELPDVFDKFKRFGTRGQNVYYVVGNHDLLFESFLDSWGDFRFLPFMNLQTGNMRIRIEHGYLYDPFFVNNPELYEKLTHLAGYVLKISPAAYKLWIAYEKFKNRRHAGEDGLAGEPPQFAEAAHVIMERGFDAVVFGHTHHPGHQKFAEGGEYINTGSFMLNPTFAMIENGKVVLDDWTPGYWSKK